MILQRLLPVAANVLQHLNTQSRCMLPSLLVSRSPLTSKFHTLGLQSIVPSNKNLLHGTDFTKSTNIVPSNFWSVNTVRTNVRIPFPRPREHKRVTKLGFAARMKTPNGRAILMRRILKGRHVLSH